MPDVWPTELRLTGEGRLLAVSFDDGGRVEIAAEILRVESPSAEVQGHGPTERKVVAGKRNVRVVRIDPVGNYAVRLHFDDGHSTGIYSWPFLRDIGARQPEVMRDYEARLAEKGLDRDRPGIG